MPAFDMTPAADRLATLVAAVPDDALGGSTPCPDMTVGDLLAGCEWLHVDFEPPDLARFYIDACGFTATSGALVRLAP